MNISTINNTTTSKSSSSVSQISPPLTSRSNSESNKASTPSLSNINNAVKSLNNFADSNNTSLSFHIDNSTGNVVIKIIDTSNLQLISQMPSEQALAMAQSLKNNSSNIQTGVLIKNLA